MFDDAKLKIKRAEKHIADLSSLVNHVAKTYPYRHSVQRHADGSYTLDFEVTEPLPADIRLIIGDALHNLRSALDFLACECVLMGGGPANYIKFPIWDDEEKLVNALNSGEIQFAGADIITLIYDVVQP